MSPNLSSGSNAENALMYEQVEYSQILCYDSNTAIWWREILFKSIETFLKYLKPTNQNQLTNQLANQPANRPSGHTTNWPTN